MKTITWGGREVLPFRTMGVRFCDSKKIPARPDSLDDLLLLRLELVIVSLNSIVRNPELKSMN